MKKLSFIPVVFLFLLYSPLLAQSREDVVYFKNGSQVHGQVLEQWPGVSIKVRFNDGTLQVYRMSDVAKIAQFDLPPQNPNAGTAAPGLPSLPASNPGPVLPSRAGKVGFGLLTGVNLANESYYGTVAGSLFGFTGGCFVDFGLSDTISIEPQLYFSMKGYSDAPYSEHLNYLELAPLFKLNFPGGPDLRFDLSTGPSIGVLLAGYDSYSGTDYDAYPFLIHGDAGWIVGGGMEIDRFLVNLRYETGFVPIGQSYTGPTNYTISLMVGYRLLN